MAISALDRTPTGRMAEAVMLVLAYLIGMGGYAATALSVTQQLPTSFGLHAVIFAVTIVGAHLFVRWLAPNADPVLLPIAVALNGMGLAMIYRLDAWYGATHPKLVVGNKQLIFTFIGLFLMVVVLAALRDHRKLRRLTYTAAAAGIVLLLLPMLPVIGVARNGARIWINLGFATFQPSELAKLCFAVFFAGYLVTRRDSLTTGGRRFLGLQLPRGRDMGPVILVWLVSLVVLVGQKDLGSSLLLFGLFVAMLYVATNRVSWLVIGAVLFAAGATAAANIFRHVHDRFQIWLHPFDNALYNRAHGGSSWQLVQGLFGMANGGLFGTGWGHGYSYLESQANSDFIYASLAEELGLAGALVIVLLYLLLVERGLRSAVAVRDGFGKLLATGLAFGIALQVFVVVGGITRVIPLTGLTLPFVAAGGSSLVVNWIILGFLIRISDSARSPAPVATGASTTEINNIIQDQQRVKSAGDGDAGPGWLRRIWPGSGADVSRGNEAAEPKPRAATEWRPTDAARARPTGRLDRHAGRRRDGQEAR